MFFFNIEKLGVPVAKVIGGKLDNKIIYLSDKREERNNCLLPFEKLDLTEGSIFQLLPEVNTDRNLTYLSGSEGSGKSYFISMLLKEMKKNKKFKDKPIFLFSEKNKDEQLDKYNISRINIGDNLIEDPLTHDDFADCIVIFDDIDAISDKTIKKAVHDLAKKLIHIGRDLHIDVFITNHNATDGLDTKHIIASAHNVVYFPFGNTERSIKYLAGTYCGLSDQQIKNIKKSGTRWCVIHKHYPNWVLTEKSLYFPNSEE